MSPPTGADLVAGEMDERSLRPGSIEQSEGGGGSGPNGQIVVGPSRLKNSKGVVTLPLPPITFVKL